MKKLNLCLLVALIIMIVVSGYIIKISMDEISAKTNELAIETRELAKKAMLVEAMFLFADRDFQGAATILGEAEKKLGPFPKEYQDVIAVIRFKALSSRK